MVGGKAAARQVTGSHEVVIETPDHGKALPDRDESEVAAYLGVLQQRLRALLEKPALRYVSVFKNRGLEAGASLVDPHSQIVALDFLPEVSGTESVWHGVTSVCTEPASSARC